MSRKEYAPTVGGQFLQAALSQSKNLKNPSISADKDFSVLPLV